MKGGHGWMHWVDGLRAPSRGQLYMEESIELLRDQLAIAESKIVLIEEKLRMECVRNKIMLAEVERQKMRARCLSKCLKGILLLCVVYLVFCTSSSGIGSDKDMLPAR